MHTSHLKHAMQPPFTALKVYVALIMPVSRHSYDSAFRIQYPCTAHVASCIPAAVVQGIDAQDQKTCDTDEGGCGRLNHIQRFLEGVPPPVFTLQLAWECHAESTEAITEVLDAVQEVRTSAS